MTNQLAKQYNFFSLVKFAFPNMLMMLFLSTYTIVDGIFISQYIGTTALSAVNMVYPVIGFQLALSIMIASGGSAVIAIKLGEGKNQIAKEDFTFLVIVEFIIGLIIAVVGYIFTDEIILAIGVSKAQFEMSQIYTKILFLFAPFFFLQTAYQSFFITAGKPGFGLVITVAAGMTNIILDYLFMGPLNMGIAGAALGTVIGYCIPSVVSLPYFAKAKSNKSLHFVKPKIDIQMLLRACGNGSSEMVTNLANSITTFLFNIIFIKYYGEDGVAAITIILYFQFVFTAVFFGYSAGVAPIISYKYGSCDTSQLKKIFKNSLIFILAASVLSYAVSSLSISSILTVFTPAQSNVYDITLSGFRIYSISFLLMGIGIFASGFFTALSDGVVSAVISFARTLVFLVCSLLLLPLVMGELGLWLAVPVAEVLGIITSIYFMATRKKKYGY